MFLGIKAQSISHHSSKACIEKYEQPEILQVTRQECIIIENNIFNQNMLWVLKRTLSMRQAKQKLKLMDKKILARRNQGFHDCLQNIPVQFD